MSTESTQTSGPEPIEILTLEAQGLAEKPRDPSKTGNKPKQLVSVEVLGYEVGRGIRKRVVNPEDVYKLAQMGSTDREIANWFSMHENTLRYNFKEILDKARTELCQSIRMAQIKLALNGNAVMLIWLGKNLLGQSDNPMASQEHQALPWSDDVDKEDGTESSAE
jgi:AraC-like DNA-binding protein